MTIVPTFDDRFLLLMACGGTKSDAPGCIPAIDRYDGPLYRDYRRHRGEGHVLPRTLILSALYGLIDCTHEIHSYDQKLTPKRADAIAFVSCHKYRFQDAFARAERVFSVAGVDYENLYARLAGPGQRHQREPGGIGMKRQAMMSFLREVSAFNRAPSDPGADFALPKE